jgi:hypothetical protein
MYRKQPEPMQSAPHRLLPDKSRANGSQHQVRSIFEQAALIWSKGSEREALYELSQDPEAIAIYASEIGPGQTAVNVAGRVITKFLFNG